MKFAHVMALLVLGIGYLVTKDLARSMDVAASWGFVISIIVFAIVLIFPLIFTGGGAIAGGSAGGGLGAILGGLGGGIASLVFFAVPIAFVLLSCFGYHFVNKWAISGLEDKAAGVTGGVLLGISFIVTFLRSSSSKR